MNRKGADPEEEKTGIRCKSDIQYPSMTSGENGIAYASVLSTLTDKSSGFAQ